MFNGVGREPPRLGVAWIDQRCPFHRSASILLVGGAFPTAVQAPAEEHDTPLSPPIPRPGIVSLDQSRPFNLSASGEI